MQLNVDDNWAIESLQTYFQSGLFILIHYFIPLVLLIKIIKYLNKEQTSGFSSVPSGH